MNHTGPLTGEYFASLDAIAATPGGDRFLVTWDTVDARSGVTYGSAVVAQVSGPPSPSQNTGLGPTFGRATFDGSDFVVVGGVAGLPPQPPEKPRVLQMQRFDRSGQASSAPITIETTVGGALATSVVSTPRGLGVGVLDLDAFRSPAPAAAAHALLVAPDGSVEEDVAFPSAVDERTGLLVAGPVGLFLFEGQVMAACEETVASLDWLGGPSRTTTVPFSIVPEPTGTPKFGTVPLFESGGELMTWGETAGQTPDGGASPISLFAGSPAGPFTRVAPVDPSALTQESDGCGGIVTLVNRNTALSIKWGDTPGHELPLGTIGAPPEGPFSGQANMTSTSAGFGVAWVASDGIHLATLAWK